jgi:hypothetical protein
MTRLLNANAISVVYMSGGGGHGHLGIIKTPVEYAVISNMPWEDPHNPGPIPLVAHGTNPMGDAQLARLRDEFRHIHTSHANVGQNHKHIILEAYDNMYTSQLEDYLL